MSISKRPLIFVFATLIAFSCFVPDRDAVAQKYTGLDMPEVYYLTPMPYDPATGLSNDQAKAIPKAVTKAYKAQLKIWSSKNRQALTAIRTGQTQVKEMLAAGGDVTANAEARKCLEEYTFPSMTQTDADTVSSLGTKRQNFLKNYLNALVTGTARAKMIDFSISKLQAHSSDATLSPGARVNAVVLISQLTDRPLARGQAPIVSANAVNALLGILNGQDPKKYPEFVKIAALSGIKNQLDIITKSGRAVDPAMNRQLVAASLELMAAPADREADAAAYWKKRQAVQLAGILKDAQTLPALLAILNDEVSSHDLKLEVVKTMLKTGSMGADAETTSNAVVSICKFAQQAVANEAAHIQGQVEEMVHNTILYGDEDLRQRGKVFAAGDVEDVAAGGPGGGGINGVAARGKKAIPMVDLPNYLLNSSRNRIRGVSIFGGRALEALRKNLDPKAEALARGTVSELSSLLKNSEVGLLNREEKRDDDEPTIEQEDRDREKSYADQMTKVCEDSAKVLAELIAGYAAE